MHQQTTTEIPVDETAIGVPNQLCSVCGDTSTGERRPISSSSFDLRPSSKEFISAETVAKVARPFSAARSNVIVTKTINVRTKVCSLGLVAVRSSNVFFA